MTGTWSEAFSQLRLWAVHTEPEASAGTSGGVTQI